MNKKINDFIYFIVMILFFVLLSMTIVSFYFIGKTDTPSFIKFFVNYHVLFMFLDSIVGLLFGALSYFFLNRRMDIKKDELNKNIELLLKLINTDEKKIIKYLSKNNNKASQYELTKIEGMTKLKVHRSLEKLELNRIVKKEKLGKVNNIYLNLKL